MPRRFTATLAFLMALLPPAALAQPATPVSDSACDGLDAKASYNRGAMYRHGKGEPLDYAKAMDCFQKSCGLGSLDGCSGVSFLYRQGLGVPTVSSDS